MATMLTIERNVGGPLSLNRVLLHLRLHLLTNAGAQMARLDQDETFPCCHWIFIAGMLEMQNGKTASRCGLGEGVGFTVCGGGFSQSPNMLLSNQSHNLQERYKENGVKYQKFGKLVPEVRLALDAIMGLETIFVRSPWQLFIEKLFSCLNQESAYSALPMTLPGGL